MNYNPDWIRFSENLEAYGILCQMFERLIIASELIDDVMEQFDEILSAHYPEARSTYFR